MKMKVLFAAIAGIAALGNSEVTRFVSNDGKTITEIIDIPVNAKAYEACVLGTPERDFIRTCIGNKRYFLERTGTEGGYSTYSIRPAFAEVTKSALCSCGFNKKPVKVKIKRKISQKSTSTPVGHFVNDTGYKMVKVQPKVHYRMTAVKMPQEVEPVVIADFTAVKMPKNSKNSNSEKLQCVKCL